MNAEIPRHLLPDVAEVYFTDGNQLGPAIALRDVGDELPGLILGTMAALERLGFKPPTIGTATSMFVYRAVDTGNHVSTNAPMNRTNIGAQLAYLFCRENSVGGIGVVLINLTDLTITTYGGRGFPEVFPSNPYTQATFEIAELKHAPKSSVEPPQEPPEKEAKAEPSAAEKKKRAAKARAAKKRAEKSAEKADVVPQDVTIQ